MDQPSSAFGSLGIAEVTEVGLSLDRKVATVAGHGGGPGRGVRGLKNAGNDSGGSIGKPPISPRIAAIATIFVASVN
jgi:hypothetical protein